MKFSKTANNSYLLRLEKGDEVISSIKLFCEKQRIKNAWLSGLGSVENTILAHYRVDTKKYSEKKIPDILEVTSLTGNVAVFENAPFVHAHASLSDDEMRALGGHLVSATVSAAFEILITDLGTEHAKKFDEEIGLKLFDLPELQ